METVFFLGNLGGIRIQKSTSKVYVKRLAMNYAILKPKFSVKRKADILPVVCTCLISNTASKWFDLGNYRDPWKEKTYDIQ